MAAHTMISNLGHVAEDITSRFSCGGKLELPKSSVVKVAYKTTTTIAHSSTSTGVGTEKDEVWSSIEFPGASKAAMIKLVDMCSVASFGYKDKDVIDKNYRDALKLDPIDFATTFQLCNSPIIREIESLIPHCAGLQAELYKLNIYLPGGFFKPHVDTPRSGQMFGSLVICLPTHFSGGELVVRHNKKEIKYNWSSSVSDPFSGLQWAAFFSDIEHEVLPVTEGYRVTLTYNLYYGTNPNRSLVDVDIKNNPFYKTFQAALSHPIFMRDGGILGYECCYSYVFDIQWADLLAFIEGKDQILSKLDCLPLKRVISYSTSRQVEELKKCCIDDTIITQILDVMPSSFPRLKGGDSIVFESAKLLNLPVHVKHFLNQVDYDDEYGFAFKSLSYGRFSYTDDVFVDEDPRLEPEFIASVLFGDTACKYKISDITWCNKEKCSWFCPADAHRGEPCGAVACYGNRGMDMWYQRAVILMGIPRWSDRCPTIETTARDSMKNDEDDMVEKCFKDLDHQKYKDMGDFY